MSTTESSIETIDMKQFVKGQASLKGMNISIIAEKLGKSQSTLSGMLIRRKMNLQVFVDILEVLEEDFVIELKNGHKYQVKL